MAKNPTPMRAIRQRCINCSGFSLKEVRDCQHTECPLHEYRQGHRPPKGTAQRTPLKAIRQHCLACCCGSALEVRLCPAESCSLQPYKMGKRPLKDDSSRIEVHAKKVEIASAFLTNKAIAGGDAQC